MLTILTKEIEFPASNQVVAKSFKLDNPSEQHHVLYRIKTTAPKRYMVRPNNGIIAPKSQETIKVSMNLSKDPVYDASKYDKFQVQSACAPLPLPTSEEEIKSCWKTLCAEGSTTEIVKNRVIAKIVTPKLFTEFSTSEMQANSSLEESRGFEDDDKSVLESQSQYEPETVTATERVSDGGIVKEGAEGGVSQPQPQRIDKALVSNNNEVPGVTPTVAVSNNSGVVLPTVVSNTGVSPTTRADRLKRERDQLKKENAKLQSSSSMRVDNKQLLYLLLAFLIGFIIAQFIKV